VVIGVDAWLLELAISELLELTASELLEICEGRLLELGVPELLLELEFIFCCPPSTGGVGSFESDEQFAKTKKIEKKRKHTRPFLDF
jgi:hypothetical protein